MIRPLLAQVLLAGVLASGATAQEGMWWCAENGERLNYEGRGVHFNEHTLCEAGTIIALTSATDDMWSGTVICNNIYVTGRDDAGRLLTTAVPVEDLTWIGLTGAGDGTLVLRTSPDGPGQYFLPCS